MFPHAVRGLAAPVGDEQDLPVRQIRRLHGLRTDTRTVQRPRGGAGERAVRTRAEDPRPAAGERGRSCGGPVGHRPEPLPGPALRLLAGTLDQQVVFVQLADHREQGRPERRTRRSRPHQLGVSVPVPVRREDLGQTGPEHRHSGAALQRDAGDPAPEVYAVVEHGHRDPRT
ncbi:hypothetical protein ACN24K_29285 [Streptomyces microflavus]